MQTELQRILELQSLYSPSATPEMQERGELIRKAMPNWLYQHAAELGDEIGVNDFFAEGRDGTGLKPRVPWVRYGSRTRSPRATEGFYVVYLFDADGQAVHLSLNQGTTDFVGGDFIPKPPKVIAARVDWARKTLADWLDESNASDNVELHDPRLGLGYENANIAAISYDLGAIPSDAELLVDALIFARGLRRLYAVQDEAPIPYEQPELQEAEESAERASGKRRTRTRAGFRTNAVEIKAIETHAVAVARAYYESEGWSVKELGKPFDLEIKKDQEKLTVEVKGTSSDGSGVPLTAGEVRHHEEAFPNNALVVVRGIALERNGSASPKVSGGTLYELRGWEIDPQSLRVISYAYEVPAELYEHEGISAENLLKEAPEAKRPEPSPASPSRRRSRASRHPRLRG